MSIADKINFSDNYDKFDLLLFIKALSQSCLEFNNYKVYKNLKQLDKFIWNMNNRRNISIKKINIIINPI